MGEQENAMVFVKSLGDLPRGMWDRLDSRTSVATRDVIIDRLTEELYSRITDSLCRQLRPKIGLVSHCELE